MPLLIDNWERKQAVRRYLLDFRSTLNKAKHIINETSVVARKVKKKTE
jgi:hypothetical protein